MSSLAGALPGLKKQAEQASGIARLERRGLLLLFSVALTLRLAAVFLLANWETVPGYECETIADNLLAGRGYSLDIFGPTVPTAHQYPLYCFFVYGHFAALGKSYLWVEVTQAVLSAASCVLLYVLGSAQLGRVTGALAAIACAVYPIYIYWVARAQALSVEIFLLLAVLVLLERAQEKDRPRDWLLTGFVFGLACLSKALYLVFLPGLLLWGMLWRRMSLSATARAAVLVVVAMAVPIAPWVARNVHVLGGFVLISSNTGYNLWVGNNEKSTGGVFSADGKPMSSEFGPDLARRLAESPTDIERDDLLKHEAVEYIRADPSGFFERMPPKLRNVWWFDPLLPTSYPTLSRVIYVPLAILALIGMVVTRRRWRAVFPYYWMYLSMSAAYAVFYGGQRFRYAIEFSLILFAAAAVVGPLTGLGGRVMRGAATRRLRRGS